MTAVKTSTRSPPRYLRRPLRVPYRSGIFDAFNDPSRFGLFYHAALMLRRGD